MLQTLEREPQESFQGLSQGGHPLGLGSVPHGGPHGELEPKRKYILKLLTQIF